jgi:Nucleotidyltransferase/DNA polymerase involved in DNA repair
MENFDYNKEPLRDILFIDVKSFYATVECAARGLNPLTTLLVVMSQADNAGNGLILASSPKAKEALHISNVTRADNLPSHPDLHIVPPRMQKYIEENLKLNQLFQTFVAEEDLLIYSIDESILDVTASLALFFPHNISRQQKRWQMARLIQRTAYQKLGLILTVGIGDNPLLAKLALDNAAKHRKQHHYIAEWRYQDIPETIWRIPNLTDFWGIGERTKRRLYRIGIDTVEQLAHANVELLRQRYGIIGEQLYHHANGIDRTILSEDAPAVKEQSYSNSQILPKDYTNIRDIKIVIGEMAEQVASRIRRHGCLTQRIQLQLRSAHCDLDKRFSHQLTIQATNQTDTLKRHCFELFERYYQGQAIRQVSLSYSKLLYTNQRQLSLFEEPEKQLAKERLDHVIDLIRERYGFTSIIHATSKLDGARSIARSHLISGHDGGAGGLDGLSKK